jgi:hypothetical protein
LLDVIINLVVRLLSVRLFREGNREVFQMAAELEAARTPANEAIVKAQQQALANLLGVGPAKAPPSSMQLSAPQKEVLPLSQPAPEPQPPVPVTPRRRGRPRKVVFDSSSSNGEANSHPSNT